MNSSVLDGVFGRVKKKESEGVKTAEQSWCHSNANTCMWLGLQLTAVLCFREAD